ncbi:MAG: UDP-N-acetylmuramoyl-L-alanine--D-glutamate ligase [Bacteroidia bacterium]|nr:UDP-N-acetylmuramoyl-L-alanine--D-glutamate ligase [Bacteroidia bacterium]
MKKERITILGGGESGVGVALLAKHLGYDVFLSDGGKIKEKYIADLINHGIDFEEGKHSEDKILQADVVVKSPGIPHETTIVQKVLQKNIPLWSDIEFGYRHCKSKIIAITGTNGKTTVTHWMHHLMLKEKPDTVMAGNVGNSFARELIRLPQPEWYVLEVSSFQLDDCHHFCPDIAILTNITPDHLNRYQNRLEYYIDAKFKITRSQTEKQTFIYNGSDPITNQNLHRCSIKSKTLKFGYNNPEFQAYCDEKKKQIHIQLNPQNTLTMTIEQLALQGRHNVYNALAVALAGQVAGIRNQKIREALMDFKGVEHRLELVMNKEGVDYINDSKATNVNSAWFALDSMTKPVVWICGGQDKGNDYSELDEVVKAKVKAMVCLGKDNRKIIEHFKDIVNVIVEAKNMNDAVVLAYRLAKKGDVVLLSPACASFDLFENYEDRGMRFKAAVKAL